MKFSIEKLIKHIEFPSKRKLLGNNERAVCIAQKHHSEILFLLEIAFRAPILCTCIPLY